MVSTGHRTRHPNWVVDTLTQWSKFPDAIGNYMGIPGRELPPPVMPWTTAKASTWNFLPVSNSPRRVQSWRRVSTRGAIDRVPHVPNSNVMMPTRLRMFLGTMSRMS